MDAMDAVSEETRDGRPPQPAARPEVLTRSRRQKLIGGVCGGAGRYFGIDPVVFRVVLAVLALSGGIGLVAYGIGWLLIPVDGEDETELQRLLSGRLEGPALTAILCVLGGTALFLSTLDQGGNELFSFLLLGALVGGVYGSRQRRARPGRGVDGDAPPAGSGTVPNPPPAAGPPPAEAPSWWREPSAGGYLWGPEDAGPGSREQPVTLTKPEPGNGARPRSSAPDAASAPAAARPVPERRGGFGPAAFLLAVLAAACAVGLSWQDHPLGTALEIGLGAALAVLGGNLVLSAFLRRPTAGTVFWSLVASVLLVAAAALPKSVGTHWANATWRPASPAELQRRYQVGTGEGTLDLTGLRLRGAAVSTSAEVGAGRLVVRVPQDATVRLTATIGLGALRLPFSGQGGDVGKPGSTQTITLVPPAGVRAGGTVTLAVRVGLGQAEVLRGDQPQ